MSRALRHEASDAPPRVAVIGLGVLAAGVMFTLLAVAGLVMVFARTEPPASTAALPRPPSPRLEVRGGDALAEVRGRGAQRLNADGRADRDAGLTHIPIERAMQITAQRGWTDVEPSS